MQKYGLSQQAREAEQKTRNGMMQSGMPGNLTRVRQCPNRCKNTSLALKSIGCARYVQGRRNVVVVSADGSSGNGGTIQDAEVRAVLFDMDGVLWYVIFMSDVNDLTLIVLLCSNMLYLWVEKRSNSYRCFAYLEKK